MAEYFAQIDPAWKTWKQGEKPHQPDWVMIGPFASKEERYTALTEELNRIYGAKWEFSRSEQFVHKHSGAGDTVLAIEVDRYTKAEILHQEIDAVLADITSMETHLEAAKAHLNELLDRDK